MKRWDSVACEQCNGCCTERRAGSGPRTASMGSRGTSTYEVAASRPDARCRNTFETEGLSINEKGEITASPPTPDVADATDASATVLARHPLVTTPLRPRQHAASWTRRQVLSFCQEACMF